MTTFTATIHTAATVEPGDTYHAAFLLAWELADAVERRTPNTSIAAAIYDALTLDDHGPGCDGPLNCVCGEPPATTRRRAPVTSVQVGDVVVSELWPYHFRVGHIAVGRKWVTLRAFHPDANVYPNPPRRVLIGGSIDIQASS